MRDARCRRRPAAAGGAVAENPAIQLAAKIASVDAGRSIDKLELVVGYEKVYGEIDKVPPRWPALVRRALVCQQVDNQVCVQSSMEAIKRLGGVDTLALNHLFEVSRFGMSSETIRAHLRDAQARTPMRSSRQPARQRKALRPPSQRPRL